ncbi:hypothetical protein J6590_040131 [Homalodisca vitripennis]|nr:hypothetical protein J6590_040131 [Homalodisca vitripennis]
MVDRLGTSGIIKRESYSGNLYPGSSCREVTIAWLTASAAANLGNRNCPVHALYSWADEFIDCEWISCSHCVVLAYHAAVQTYLLALLLESPPDWDGCPGAVDQGRRQTRWIIMVQTV